ncbi:MAG: hypothetical protein Alpg2KO_14960 [Alphaproteobacteria bacterium]
MTAQTNLHAKLNAQMLVEFRDDAEDRLEVMQGLVDSIASASEPDPTSVAKLQAQTYGFVGTGKSFGFPVVSAIATRLADYLGRSADQGDLVCEEVQEFLDAINRVVELGRNPSEEEATLVLRSLPVFSNFDVSSVSMREASILMVSSARVVSVMVADELYNCGYRATIIDNPFEALALAVQMKPDCIITASQLEGLSGIDLCRALRAVSATRNTPIALLTSFRKGHTELSGLPEDVDVVRLGDSLSDDLAEYLSHPNLA